MKTCVFDKFDKISDYHSYVDRLLIIIAIKMLIGK